MKHIKIISLLFLIAYFENSKAQTYSQPAEVISAGGGESSGGNYSNFGVIGETFVDSCITGGNYNTSIGFIYDVACGEIVGIDEMNLNNQIIKIYPNPNTGEFVIEMEITEPQELEIKLLNVIGQVIYEEGLNQYTGKYQKTIDISKQATGIYTLQLISNEGIINKKIIIE